MNILINASNLSGGGGAQVCDSICRYLADYPQHKFTVVLPTTFNKLAEGLRDFPNVKVERFACKPGDIKAFITFRIPFLDALVERNQIGCVFTVFGPVKWRPRCPHVCGFALSQIVLTKSPFFKIMDLRERLSWWKTTTIWKLIFHRSADGLITENPLISKLLGKKIKGKKIVTITNNYNQVFDQPERWVKHLLPPFEGTQMLDVTSAGPHKNLPISLSIARILKDAHPEFKFRFVFTIKEEEFPTVPDFLKDCFLFIGKVAIEECPSLYEQCDIVFQPTLLECFTATFAESMKMKVPIVACDLDFARGLCGNAALFFSPFSASSAAEKIYSLASNKDLQKKLIEAGRVQLQEFDTAKQRADKTIQFCERISYSSQQ